MYFGFCVRVLVVSLLTFGQHANALGYRSEGSSGIKPLFDYSRNHKLAFASNFESSAQPGGFLGSSGSSHSEGGQVDRYSPKRSVSSYGSNSLDIRKPTQNSQQPPQTNPNANVVIQNKADMLDLVLPQNGQRFDLGIASSKGIIMLTGPQPPSQPQEHGYQPQEHGYQPPSHPQEHGYQPPSHPQKHGYRSGASSAIKPLFDYPRNQKLTLASDFESSAKPGSFLGSPGSSLGKGGQIDGYTPEGSVSSYGSGSFNIQKPTQNSQQPPQTNSNANGVIQNKADMLDLVLPQNGKIFDLGIASSKGIIMLAGPQPPSEPQSSVYLTQPKPQQGVLQTKAGMWDIGSVSGPNVQPGSQSKPQYPSYPSLPKLQKPSYPPKPQQGVLQTKAGMWDIGSVSGPNVQPGSQSKPQYPGYPSLPKLQKPSYLPKPQQGVLQTKAGMWDIGSVSGQNVQPGSPPKPQKTNLLPSFQQPSYTPKPQQGVLQTKAGMWDIGSVSGPNVQPGSQSKPQYPGYPSLPKLQKPSYPPKPQQGVLQTKAGMWDIFSPIASVSDPNVQPGSPHMPQKPSFAPHQPSFKNPGYTPNPQKPGYLPPSQQGVLQTKAGIWDTFSPGCGISGPNMQRVYLPKPQLPGYLPTPQRPSFPPQQPSFQQPGYMFKPRKPSYLPLSQQGVLQTKAGMWDIFSPGGNVSGVNVQPGSQPKPQKPGYSPKPQFPSLPKLQEPSYPPKPQQGVLQTKAGMWDIFSPVDDNSGPNVQRVYLLKPQKPSYLPKPHQGVLQTKAGMWDIFSPVGSISGPIVQPGSRPKPLKPNFPQTGITPKPQQPGYLPQQGVLQTKAGMWDIFSPVGGVSGPNVQPGSPPMPQKPSFKNPGYTPKPQKPGYLPHSQQGVLQTKAGMWDIFSPVGNVSGVNVQPGSQPKPQKPGYSPKPQYPPLPKLQEPSYPPKPQQGVLQTKAGMWHIFSPVDDNSGSNVQRVYLPRPQQPSYLPKPQMPSYLPKPQQGVLQTKAGMWDIFSPVGSVSSPIVQTGSQTKPQKPGYSPKPQFPSLPKLQEPSYPPKPQQGVLQTKAGMWNIFSPVDDNSGPNVQRVYLPKPQQGVLQTKAGMWDIFSPVGSVSGPIVQPGSRPKPLKPNFPQTGITPKPQQPGNLPHQGVLQTKAGMWDIFSPVGGVSGPNVQPGSPSSPKPQQPSFQQPGYTSKPQKPSYLAKPQQGVLQTKAGMWDIFSPVGGVSGPNWQPGSPPMPQKPSFKNPGYTPKPQKPGYLPHSQQGVLQTKAGMWDIFSPVGSVSSPIVQTGSQTKPQKPGYSPKPQFPSPPKPQFPFPPKPQQPGYLPQPQQGVLQTKAGMWYIFSPVGNVSGVNVQPGSQPKPQKPGYSPKLQEPSYPPKPLKPSFLQPSYSPKPQQPGYLPQPQQGVLQTKAGMWDIFSPVGVSGPNVQPANLNVQLNVAQRTRQIPMSSPQRPRWQQSLVPV